MDENPYSPRAGPSLEVHATNRWWNWWMIAGLTVLAVPVLSCAGFSIWFDGTFQPVRQWKDLGPVQVLGGPEEAWLFIEVEHLIRLPGAGVSAPTRSVGHRQKVVAFDRSGVKKQVAVSKQNGVSFHPSSQYVFKREDGIYLYEDWSMRTHRSIYKWADDHFDLLPLETSERLLKAWGIEYKVSPLKEVPAETGWHLIHTSRGDPLDDVSFAWLGQTFEIEKKQGPANTQVWLRCIGPDERWAARLAEYDHRHTTISRRQCAKLSNSTRQKGHSR